LEFAVGFIIMQNRLEMLRIYCAAVEGGSFKEAAVRLGISPQAVTRAVQEAEALVGEILFHRNTRRVRATEAGEAFAHRARDLVQQMDQLLKPKDTKVDAEISGPVRLTAPKSVGQRFLMPALARLAEKHPRLMLDLRLSDAISDPISEQIDIGVRLGFMRDSRFVVRPASRVGFSVIASPRLIARVGKPANLAELALMPTTGFIDRNTGRPWPWQFADGQHLTMTNLALQTDDADCECQAVVAAVGFGQIVSYLAQPLLRAGQVVSLLDDMAPAPWPVCVYRPQRGPVPARIRLVFDAVHAALEKSDLLHGPHVPD
jgi:DNA-binding transcriptional LysR family regulator